MSRDEAMVKVSLAGIGTWEVTDDVLTYWREGDAYRLFEAKVMSLDSKKCVARVLCSDGSESWLPYGYIHKK